jgi:hypothetical protein
MAVRSSSFFAGRPTNSKRFLALSYVREVDPKAILRLEVLGELKNPVTSSGIYTSTF